ncbi:MAG TPA: type II toxin-antitoxin system CcdA family antitoxin [Solirubrobacteraceae bacterium]|nr:type II toxin-antitoxin system CcdA family antitoxin [Solirubrobacteraceae bacterium]
MARVNITVPDELIDAARSARLNVSRIAAAALAEELDRRAKIAALDGYLQELENELGPISLDDQAAARAGADRAFADGVRQAPSRTRPAA